MTQAGENLHQADIRKVLKYFSSENLENELTADGVGSDFYKQLSGPKASVPTVEFIRWVFTESKGLALLDKFEGMFTDCDVIEHYSNSYLIKVSKDSYSIGYLFGLMEDIKDQFAVREYSVSQTTLE